MKTLVLSMISIAATIAAMTACTSESDPINEITNPKDAKVEIKLNAGVVEVTTKAGPVSDTKATEFAAETPIQLIRWDYTETLDNLDWTANAYKTVNATASGAAITFSTPQYYDENGKSTSFIGFYPALKEGSITLSDNGTVQFTGLDGQTDILSAELVNVGSQAKVTEESKRNIQFKHMLSQLKFKLSGTEDANETFGKIKKISLLNIATDLNMTLGKTAEEITIVIPKDASQGNLTVLNMQEGEEASINSLLDKEYIIMIPPRLGSSENKIEIQIETTTHDSTNPIKVNINDFEGDGTGSGTANEITLTFKDKITVTTAITGWDKGEDKNYGIE